MTPTKKSLISVWDEVTYKHINFDSNVSNLLKHEMYQLIRSPLTYIS